MKEISLLSQVEFALIQARGEAERRAVVEIVTRMLEVSLRPCRRLPKPTYAERKAFLRYLPFVDQMRNGQYRQQRQYQSPWE
jgi:hypothetical protein